MSSAAIPSFAFEACTAAQIINGDGNCPADETLPCNIRSTVTLPAASSACTFDFGKRAVAIGSPGSGSGKIQFGSKMVTLIAGSLTVYSNGSIQGIGSGAAPDDRGGTLSIQTTGTVTLLGKVDVSGNTAGGTVTVSSGGVVSVSSVVDAGRNVNRTTAGGGMVRITSSQDILVSGEITAIGGSASPGGGEIDLTSTGKTEVSGKLTIAGADGGVIDVQAGTIAVIKTIDAAASGDAGSGGTVSISGNSGVQITGVVDVGGHGGSVDSGGGCGGLISVEAPLGGIAFSGKALAEGAGPDGEGGEIELVAKGDIVIAAASGTAVTTIFSAGGVGDDGCGGQISVESDRDIVFQSTSSVDTSGGAAGGQATIAAGRNMTIAAKFDVSGRSSGSTGGALIMEAGRDTPGSLTVSKEVDIDGGGCSAERGCGAGGSADISACALTVAGSGMIHARGSDGGQLSLTARQQMTIGGSLNASKTAAATGVQGGVILRYRTSSLPTISGTVSPEAATSAQPLCTGPAQDNCLQPCPVCGNGTKEYPEDCDTGAAANCDAGACSAYCRFENCNDGLTCTSDSCDVTLGCLNLPLPAPCSEPTDTPSVTPTSTVTSTPTRTSTPTQTIRPSATPPAPPSATATRTPTAGTCPGDCNGNQSVNSDELSRVISLINLCNGNAGGCAALPGQACTAADINANGVISASELGHIVADKIQFPGGCPP